MKDSLKMGIGFGITSGTITTLGLIVGLYSGTLSRLAIVGGVFTIAIADAFSDSVGLHLSKKFVNKDSRKEIWTSTLSTFISKFFIAISFLIPIIIFPLQKAVIISIIWGFTILSLFSFCIAKIQRKKAWPTILEHTATALIVVITTQIMGQIIRKFFA